MSYILGLDTSQFQGANIDFSQVKAAGYQFVIQRISYSYPGAPSRYDPTATRNYYGFKGVGLIVGGYHKIGWTDPIAEADFFIAGMSPLADGDLLAYDIEPASDVAVPSNWSAWEQSFVQRIHDKTGTWPLRYLNISMNNAMPREGVVSNCTSWVAAPSFGWDANVPVNVPVIIQQGPEVHVPGITANVCDTDAFFGQGTPDELQSELLKLAYHAPKPVTPPAPPAPVPQPAPTPEPTVSPAAPPSVAPSPQPVPEPTPTPKPAQTAPNEPTAPKIVVPEPTYYRVWDLLLALFKKLLGRR